VIRKTLLAALAVATAACASPLPTEPELAGQIEAIEAHILPVVTELHVSEYYAGGPCSYLVYGRGSYTSLPAGCGEGGDPFDDEARADHQRVAASLTGSGTFIERILGAAYDDGGEPQYIFFSSTFGAPWGASWELLYDPGGDFPVETSGPVEFTRVADDWWFVCCND
jgi:hypothetical protein